MDRINGYPVYHLGAMVGQLVAALAKPSVTFGDVALPALNAQSALENVAADSILHLPLSKTAATQLAQAVRWLRSNENLAQPQVILNSDTIGALLAGIFSFQTVLSAELGQLDLYFVSRKGAFDTKTLIFGAEQVIPAKFQADLGAQVMDDVKEAGRCLVFALPTAVGFHMFRAVEAVVMRYFPHINFTPKESDRNLGRYIQALSDAGVDDKIVGMLLHLKDFYRNPISHPELFLTPEEALGLFGFAPSAISAMASDLEKLKAGKALVPKKGPSRSMAT